MAEVLLIDYTGKGRHDQAWHAANILLFTKNTRLEMDPGLLKAIEEDWTRDKKREELEYMARTIPSSWEFVDLTFLIKDVSRATAQQITRTRTGSYAMQSQRVTDVREAGVVNPFDEGSELSRRFSMAAEHSFKRYQAMIGLGAALQDARGMLPLATQCNLVTKYNLRSFVELIRARASLRTQGEYHDIADQMKALTLGAWPWSEPFFVPPHEHAIEILEGVVREEFHDMEPGKGAGWDIAKAIDLLRKV